MGPVLPLWPCPFLPVLLNLLLHTFHTPATTYLQFLYPQTFLPCSCTHVRAVRLGVAAILHHFIVFIFPTSSVFLFSSDLVGIPICGLFIDGIYSGISPALRCHRHLIPTPLLLPARHGKLPANISTGFETDTMRRFWDYRHYRFSSLLLFAGPHFPHPPGDF